MGKYSLHNGAHYQRHSEACFFGLISLRDLSITPVFRPSFIGFFHSTNFFKCQLYVRHCQRWLGYKIEQNRKSHCPWRAGFPSDGARWTVRNKEIIQYVRGYVL